MTSQGKNNNSQFWDFIKIIFQAGMYRFIALCLLFSLEIVEAWCGMDKQQQKSNVSLLLE